MLLEFFIPRAFLAELLCQRSLGSNTVTAAELIIYYIKDAVKALAAVLYLQYAAILALLRKTDTVYFSEAFTAIRFLDLLRCKRKFCKYSVYEFIDDFHFIST